MKVSTRSATDGIREQDGQLVFDFSLDKQDDYLSLIADELHGDTFLGNTYHFGYQFYDNISSQDRSKVIHFIKGLAEQKPRPSDLHKFIEKPLVLLDREINLTTIDCIITPRSGRSPLVSQVIQQIGDFLRHDVPPVFFELIKSLPKSIQVDWSKFVNDVPFGASKSEDNRHRQMRDKLFDILQKAQEKDYFSIAQLIPAKYRSYIKDYLKFEDIEKENAFKELQNKRLLIVDDINTTGATLKEILRIIKQVNNSCEIYIFTLIGKGD
ncbi:MAG: phosphoribosyltransferase [Acetobacter sp.]|nr:phosphoribosyltransferase [Acetobacter sp.]